MRQGSRPASGRRSRTCAPTGARTRSGNPRWTRRSARRSTGSGRRPSRGPSTGSTRQQSTEGPASPERPPGPRLLPACLSVAPVAAAILRPVGVPTLETEVLVIGGGSTGAGAVRDAAMRGFATALVERGDLATGTTGRFHGLLHSGGRYAVKDPIAARECVVENAILRRTASDCIEDTGGLFVTTRWDDPAFGDDFLQGCRETGVPVEEITGAEALRREPRLDPTISRAFAVPDASLDPWKLVWGCARSAREHGARILPYHRVVDLERNGDRISGAVVRNDATGEELRIHADVVVNAAGAWAGQIAALAGCKVTVLPGKGIMIAMNHRLVNTVVNRCKPPADGDIIVPIRTVSVIGTTDVRVADPDELEVTQGEVEQMLDEGEKLVPGSEEERFYWLGSRLRAREPVPRSEEIICECELITRDRLEQAIVRRP